MVTNRRTDAALLPMLAGVLVSAACASGEPLAPEGDSTNRSGTEPKTATAEAVRDTPSLCRARAKLECTTNVARSCGAASVDACLGHRTSTCLSHVPQGTELVVESVPACLDAVRDAHMDGALTRDELDAIAAACGPRLFSGTGAARTSCVTSYDCRTRDKLECIVDRGAKSGRCQVPSHVAPGDRCAGEADVCDERYFCDRTSQQCIPFAREAEPCDVSRPCPPDLKACNPLGSVWGAKCEPKLGLGLPCRADGECATGLCDKLDRVADGTCAKQIALEKLDAECATYR